MHTKTLEEWSHDHTFGQDRKKEGETRTLIVIVLTAITMVVEIAAGLAFGSMALLADGLHMASHASALAIAYYAYHFARRHANNRKFSFGTGKVNSLAGFASAVLLIVFALLMAWESIDRLLNPVSIAFNQAITVAVVGLVVNVVSAFILNPADHQHSHDHDHGGSHGHHDHNLKAAYLHVVADALTSLLAIVALFSAKLLGWNGIDPVVALLGVVLITRWSIGLMKESSSVLLDQQMDGHVAQRAVEKLESDDDTKVADLHVWPIGPGLKAGAMTIVSHDPKSPDVYKAKLQEVVDVKHITVEVHRCQELPS